VANEDQFLINKKGKPFMPIAERLEIVNSIGCVDVVTTWGRDDVSGALAYIAPDIFAKGGDRLVDNMPASELDVCQRLGIEIRYGVGGGKIQSSSWLIQASNEEVSD